MSAGQFLFILITWIGVQKIASYAANAADEGRSWMGALGISEREHLVWLRAL